MSEDLFAGFPYTTTAEWIAQIEKDLKGRSRSEMQWSPDGQLNIDPFVHAEDVPYSTSPIDAFGKWQIAESFVVNDARESNLQILDALRGGIESLQISCADNIDWNLLLGEVELPFIHVGLEVRGDAQQALRSFYHYASRTYRPEELSVSLRCSDRDMPIGSQASPIPLLEEHPYVRIALSPASGKHLTEGLCATILETLVFGDWNPAVLSKCDLWVTVGMHYLVEIARLRALRILWANVSSVLQFSVSHDFAIEARTADYRSEEDPYPYMIRSTVTGLAGILGGADRIDIQPADGSNHSKAFYRHLARNIHHLLRMESKFSEIPDPVAGAYYIERLTHELVEKTWELLVLKMK